MRVLLVTLTDILPYTLAKVLNPSLEYCAIVVDDVDTARYMFKDSKLLQDLIYPLYELKECISENYFDFAICVMNSWWNKMAAELKNCGLPKNKLIDIGITENKFHFRNFFLERALRYFIANSSKFEMFATGASRIQHGLVPKVFKNHKLFNFGSSSEDLYYNYQIARHILIQARGGGRKIALLNMF